MIYSITHRTQRRDERARLGFPHKTDNPAKLCLTLHVVFMLDGSTLNVDGRAVFQPSSSMSDPAIQRSIIAIISSRGIHWWWGMTSSMSTMKQNMYELTTAARTLPVCEGRVRVFSSCPCESSWSTWCTTAVSCTCIMFPLSKYM
jgi:hypothetical protein